MSVWLPALSQLLSFLWVLLIKVPFYLTIRWFSEIRASRIDGNEMSVRDYTPKLPFGLRQEESASSDMPN